MLRKAKKAVKNMTFIKTERKYEKFECSNAEMQLTVGPVGPRGQNFRGSGK
jgi:hypothetical protein